MDESQICMYAQLIRELLGDCYYELEDVASVKATESQDEFQALIAILQRKLSVADQLLSIVENKSGVGLKKSTRHAKLLVVLSLATEAAEHARALSADRVVVCLAAAIAAAVNQLQLEPEEA